MLRKPAIFWFMLLVALGAVTGLDGHAFPVAAQEEPTQEPVVLIVTVIGNADLSDTILPTFQTGETFSVAIIVEDATAPGIFGSQFEISYDPAYLRVQEGSLLTSPALEPVIIAQAEIDPQSGRAYFAASRRGDVENLTGRLILATLDFEVVNSPALPQGQSTLISLANVKLGAKGGLDVPVLGIVDQEILIVPEDANPAIIELTGQALVEGRSIGNQAGHQLLITDSQGNTLPAVTSAEGNFSFTAVPADTYTLTAVSPGFLPATCVVIETTTETLLNLAPVTLLAGDIDSSGEIDIADAVAVGAALDRNDPADVANLNRDTQVDILDLILMSANFGQTAAGNPWNCLLN